MICVTEHAGVFKKLFNVQIFTCKPQGLSSNHDP